MLKTYDEFVVEMNFAKFMNHRYEDEVKSSLWDYVGGYTSGVNDELRKGRKVPVVTDALDRAFTEKRKIDVYRTVDWMYMKNIYGITKKNVESKIGEVLTNKGYMSTASVMTSPWSDKWSSDELLFHITSDFPYPCVDVNSVFNADEIDCEFQQEVLLPRNTKLRIEGVSFKKGGKFAADGTCVIEAKIVR